MSVTVTKATSPFLPKGCQISAKEYDQEFVHYYEKETIVDPEKFDPEKPDEFLTEKKVVEFERLPIKEYINQFASKVGLKNELKGVISGAQMDEFIQEHQAQPGFTDLTKLPDSLFEIEQLAKKVDNAWENIPGELKGDLSKEEFMKTLTSDKIAAYIKSQIPAEKKKEGEE